MLLYDHMDLLDFAGPSEVLALTAYDGIQQQLMLYKKRLPKNVPFEVKTMTESGNIIHTHGGVPITPDYTLDQAPAFDIIIVPGGPLRAINQMSRSSKVLDYLKQNQSEAVVCSVCTGALILAAAGLLDGKKATSHHLVHSMLSKRGRDVRVIRDKKVVRDGSVITSGGISSGIHLALYLVEEFVSPGAAIRTARILEFDGYQPDGILTVNGSQ